MLYMLIFLIDIFCLFFDSQVGARLAPKMNHGQISSDIMPSQIPPLCCQLFGLSRPTGSTVVGNYCRRWLGWESMNS